MARDSRRSRSPDRNRRLYRSRSPSRHRSPSPSRHRGSNRRYNRKEDRSPPRRRSRERSQHSARPTQGHQHQVRDHERAYSPVKNNKTRSPSPLPLPPSTDHEALKTTEEPIQQMTEEEQMNALLGFGGFSTTKGKAVAGNNVGAANVKKQRKFRQYMNRKGGFNRLLDK
ncbi:hypothetical protein GGI20_003123 [Coemansia sp. BCRC 34301]|nr:hypothetical protein GGI20_003123 [Coemansia sp. BCRC 34301]